MSVAEGNFLVSQSRRQVAINFGMMMMRPPPQYPSSGEWKPRVLVPELQAGQGAGDDREGAAQAILAGDRTRATLLYFMWETLGMLTATASEKWESYNQVIALKGAKYTAQNLLVRIAASPEDEKAGRVAGDPVPMNRRMAMIMNIAAGFRAQTKKKQERTFMSTYELKDQVQNLTRGHPFMVKDLTMDMFHEFSGMFDDTNIRRMIAALDMFLHKNEDNVWAAVRIGTLYTRFEDCSALTSMDHLSRVIGQDIEVCVDFIVDEKCLNEFKKMYKDKDKEELHKADSYMPYLRSARAVKRSPYSVTENRFLHHFIHTVGSLLGDARSSRAVLLRDHSFALTLPLAFWYAKKMGASPVITRQMLERPEGFAEFAKEFKNKKEENEEKNKGGDREETISARDLSPNDFKRLVRNWDPEPEAINLMIKEAGLAGNLPPGTIGNTLLNYARVQ